VEFRFYGSELLPHQLLASYFVHGVVVIGTPKSDIPPTWKVMFLLFLVVAHICTDIAHVTQLVSTSEQIICAGLYL